MKTMIFCAGVLIPTALSGQNCDPDITRNAKPSDPYRYSQRGDRCEGFYESDVSATTIWIASFTDTFGAYDLDAGGALIVNWSAPEAGSAQVRAQSTSRNYYYRMDVHRGPGSQFYAWPTEFLEAAEIGRDDLGLLAWTEVGEHQLVLPVRVQQNGEPSGDGRYELTVVPNVRLDSVFVSVAPVAEVGRRATGNFLVRNEPVGQRRFPAQRPIVIGMPELAEAGIYVVEVSARRRGGGTEAMDAIWFYHPGN